VDVIENLKTLLTPPLTKAGYELASLTLSRDKEGLTLHLMVDRDAPISLDDIVKVSDLINPLLDQADPINEAYTLDVSSLGAEKPLKLATLERYVDRYVAFHLAKPYQGENHLEGTLLEVTPTTLTLRIKNKTRSKDVTLAREDVDKANLAIKFWFFSKGNKTMDAAVFKKAIDEIAESKGISHEAVVEALTEALQRAYIKYLGGGDDAVVEAKIDEENGRITLAQIKNVKKDVEDDYLEISPADAKEDADEAMENLQDDLKDTKDANVKADLKDLIEKVQAAKDGIKIGGTYAMYCPLDELSKLTAMAVKSNLRIKIAEAERVALYDVYKDHIGEMVTGTVEKADDRSVSVNIGRTSVELTRREMIGDEYFKVGDPIKVYIQEVKDVSQETKGPRGPQIEVTRSSEGFLKRLFEEEIHVRSVLGENGLGHQRSSRNDFNQSRNDGTESQPESLCDRNGAWK
jgi:Uncharacterized protein conserved in bacteria